MVGLFGRPQNAPGEDAVKPVPDKGISRFFFLIGNHFGKLVAVNLLFLALCIPIVTAPAALSALNRVLIKLVRDGNCFLAHEFFKEFKGSFKKSLAAGLLFAAMLGVSYYFLSLSMSNQNVLYSMLFAALGLLALPFTLPLACYTFILIPMLDLPLRQLLSNALRLSMINRKRAFAVLGACVLGLAVLLFAFPISLIPLAVFGVSLLQLVLCMIVNVPVQAYVIAPFEASRQHAA